MTGNRLKEILAKTGLSQTEIANKLGISVQNLNNKLETKDVKTGLLEELCAALNMDITDFIKSDRIGIIEKSITNIGNGSSNIDSTTHDDRLLTIMEKQSEQITTAQSQVSVAQQQITDLIEIIKRK